MAVSLQFPSHKTIERYLRKHPATQDRAFKNKKIIALAALRFANKEKLQLNVQIGAMDVIYDPIIRLKAKYGDETTIIFNLTKALIDCANSSKERRERRNQKI